jgi:hypothetical protein
MYNFFSFFIDLRFWYTLSTQDLQLSFLTVSWADLIAVAGAEAVELCGGPEIPVRLGRLDSRYILFLQFPCS